MDGKFTEIFNHLTFDCDFFHNIICMTKHNKINLLE